MVQAVSYPMCCGAHFLIDIEEKDLQTPPTFPTDNRYSEYDRKYYEARYKSNLDYTLSCNKAMAYRIAVLTPEQNKKFGSKLLEYGFELKGNTGKQKVKSFLYVLSKKPLKVEDENKQS